MIALSIRQPWAWLIIHGHKPLENRTWATKFRGRIAVHAAKGMSRREYDEARAFAEARGVTIPPFEMFADGFHESPQHSITTRRGSVIGSVDFVDVVFSLEEAKQKQVDRWYTGQIGFVLKEPRIAPEWIPVRGALGFFRVEGMPASIR